MSKTEFEFAPRRILKNNDHIILNHGEEYNEQVQHLEKQGDEFVELKKQEAAVKHGSKKLLRKLNQKSRDKLEVDDPGLQQTPDWFEHLIPVVDWSQGTFLYELSHLWMNMFFSRELYGDSRTGEEKILVLKNREDGNGLDLKVLAKLVYDGDADRSFEDEEVEGFIVVDLPEREAISIQCNECGFSEQVDTQGEAEEVAENHEHPEALLMSPVMTDFDVEFKQSVFEEGSVHIESIRELLTGICLKHDYDDEQLVFSVEQKDETVEVEILNKDFTVVIPSDSEFLDESAGSWVRELFLQDGCPINLGDME